MPGAMWAPRQELEMQRPETSQQVRIDELETRVAQQDHSIAQLSDEVYRQQQQLAELEIKLRHLADRLRQIATPEQSGEPTYEVPPHY
jgi:uncharacterized coiled-coil protein SlyX